VQRTTLDELYSFDEKEHVNVGKGSTRWPRAAVYWAGGLAVCREVVGLEMSICNAQIPNTQVGTSCDRVEGSIEVH
jgi:hypothetical protein